MGIEADPTADGACRPLGGAAYMVSAQAAHRRQTMPHPLSWLAWCFSSLVFAAVTWVHGAGVVEVACRRRRMRDDGGDVGAAASRDGCPDPAW